MSDKPERPKELRVKGISIKSEVSDDGRDIFIRLRFPEKIESYEQIDYILHYYFAVADFKYVEMDRETIIQ